MIDIGRPDPPIAARHHRQRFTATPSPQHPAQRAERAPGWVGTEADAQWVRVREEIHGLRQMKDVKRASHDCQVAVARLASISEGPGPVGETARRAMQSLVLDVHSEHRGAVAREAQQTRTRHRWLYPGSVVDWVLSPVGSGDRSLAADHQYVTRSYRIAVLTRLLGVVVACAALLRGLPLVAATVLVASVMSSGWRRYRDHLEPAVTFRARYFSCLLGHLGDVLVLTTATFWLSSAGVAWWPAPVAITVMLFATAVRTGALQVGVFVPRYRVDRVIRVGSMSVGIVLVAMGIPLGFLVTLTGIGAFSAMEIYRILREVWGAGVTEFAWMSSTSAGYVSSLFVGPLPDPTDHKETP